MGWLGQLARAGSRVSHRLRMGHTSERVESTTRSPLVAFSGLFHILLDEVKRVTLAVVAPIVGAKIGGEEWRLLQPRQMSAIVCNKSWPSVGLCSLWLASQGSTHPSSAALGVACRVPGPPRRSRTAHKRCLRRGSLHKRHLHRECFGEFRSSGETSFATSKWVSQSCSVCLSRGAAEPSFELFRTAKHLGAACAGVAPVRSISL